MEEAWSVVEQAEQAGASFASKDLLDARLILVQVSDGLRPSPNGAYFFFLWIILCSKR